MDFDEHYKRDKIHVLSVEINYHSMLIMVNYEPVYEVILNGDEFKFKVFQLNMDVKDKGHTYLEKCRKVTVKSGACKRTPCQVYTGHRFFDFKMRGWPRCMGITKPRCGSGYCMNGNCRESEFGDVCECKSKGFLRSDWIGEFCSIGKSEALERIVTLTQGYETEIDFEEDEVQINLVSNFEDLSWKYFYLRLYELHYINNTIIQVLTQYKNAVTGSYTSFNDIKPNTTYLITSYGRETNLPQRTNRQEQSFVHFTEIHTPGYSYLPAPTNLQITAVPGNLFNLSWSYSSPEPAKEFLIRMQLLSDQVEEEVTDDRHDLLALRSNTTYNISVAAINSVGDYKYESVPLDFTSPVFIFNKTDYGSYDFAEWLFQKNTISLQNRFVYFKSTIRRDTRIERVVIMLHTGDIPEDQQANVLFHAARFNQSYSNHELHSPYVTASFTFYPLPRRLYLGDRYDYEEFNNGPLEKGLRYGVYTIVWYKSGNQVQVSVQMLGTVSLSKIPWVTIFISISVGSLALTIVSGLFNCCCFHIILAHRKKRQDVLEKKLSQKSLVVESVYMNSILSDAEYDMTTQSQEDLETVMRHHVDLADSDYD